MDGLIPELEEREAALFNGYTWREWLEFDLLDPEGRWNRAAGVAFYRMHRLVQQHVDDIVYSETERKAKAGRNGQ